MGDIINDLAKLEVEDPAKYLHRKGMAEKSVNDILSDRNASQKRVDIAFKLIKLYKIKVK